jgi:hypothetical protein
MADDTEGAPDLEGRVEHVETAVDRIVSKLDELLGGGRKKAEDHEADKLDRPTEVQEQVRAELARAEQEKAAKAMADGDKAEKQTMAQRLAKLEEAPPVQPQPRRQRAMWGRR